MSVHGHTGYVESCHSPCVEDTSWYANAECSEAYCKALNTGSFIPCGNSGNVGFVLSKKTKNLAAEGHDFKDCNMFCCCFVYGQECKTDILLRRWSCCGQSVRGTLLDVLSIVGCPSTKND